MKRIPGMWGRGKMTVLAVAVAVVLVMAPAALAANGKPFLLGKRIVATAVSTLIKRGPGPALKLAVRPGQPPLAVSSSGKVANLNADRLDGKDASQIGVNGHEQHSSTSADNSNSPKTATADCPSGKILVGSGYNISGGKTGATETDVVLDEMAPHGTFVFAEAYEEEPTSANWNVTVYAICATAP
jgi:hypothetical protein